MKELFVEAKIENLYLVLDFVNSHIEDRPPKIRNQLGIVIDEVFSNISRYAYTPGIGSAAIRISVDENITLEFEDSGVAYNPLLSMTPNIALSADEREVGGLGLLMVKNLTDSVEYKRVCNKNILTITKRLQV